MKITATQGPGVYLLDLGPDPETSIPQGQIIDTRRGRAYSPHSVASILARGYWEDCEFTDAETAVILERVDPRGRTGRHRGPRSRDG